jgi:hypothetical protein
VADGANWSALAKIGIEQTSTAAATAPVSQARMQWRRVTDLARRMN